MYKNILNVLVVQDVKRRLTMAELAFKAIMFFGVYVPLTIYSLVITFADIRFWVLTIFLVITGVWKFARWLRKDDRMNELKKQEIESLRLENKLKELDMRERELQISEREKKIVKP